ncbi:hypothetical protein GJU40_13020 [Bacillus lacus]|uniref:STAS domain-containing protein n=2 Tax=Metabacillus lacus TaxID=1983721 RepID=A0A7X2J1Q1_9BACI|nr:hypothetical protein [Metabacillus lacus]
MTKLKSAASLIGVKMVVSGIRPNMAKHWVMSGTDGIQIEHYSSMKQALAAVKLLLPDAK